MKVSKITKLNETDAASWCSLSLLTPKHLQHDHTKYYQNKFIFYDILIS